MKININIGEVLSKAWKITWKFKVLWIFGILAGCAGSNRANFNSNFNSGSSGGGGGKGTGNGSMDQFFNQLSNMQPDRLFKEFIAPYTAIIIGVLVLLCVLWIVFYFLGVMGRVGLIKGAKKADTGAESIRFSELWSESTPYFWRMFGLNLLVGLPFFLITIILLLVLGISGYATYQSGVGGAGLAAIIISLVGIFIGGICVISVLSLIVGMVVEQSQNAIVLDDLGVIPSLSRGWNIFKGSVLPIVLIAIILGIVGGIVGFIIALPLIGLILVVGAGTAFTAMAASGSAIAGPLFLGACCVVLYMPVLLLGSGILQTYMQTVWTLVYRRLTITPAPEPAAIVPELSPAL